MKVRLVTTLIFIALAVGLLAPAGIVSANGAKHVYATASSVSLCFGVDTPHPDCHFATPTPLPNGRLEIRGMVNVMQFTSSDPRWNALCIFTADPFTIADNKTNPLMGSFVCTPNDAALQGWWEGSVTEVFQADGNVIARFTAKGYGAFDRMTTISWNSMSAHGPLDIEIIELP